MNRIPIRLAFSVLICLLSQVGFCSQERIVPPSEVSIGADVGAPFGEVKLDAQAQELSLKLFIGDIKFLVDDISG